MQQAYEPADVDALARPALRVLAAANVVIAFALAMLAALMLVQR